MFAPHCDVDTRWVHSYLETGSKSCKSSEAIMLLLVKCYDIKIVKLPGFFFYRISFMQLTKKNIFTLHNLELGASLVRG